MNFRERPQPSPGPRSGVRRLAVLSRTVVPRTVLLAAVLLAAVLAAVLAAGCTGHAEGGLERGESGHVGAIQSKDLRLQRGTVEPMVLLTGELVAEDAIRLATPNVNIWPMTLRWIAEEGDAVAEGDTVVEFDNSQLASNLEGLRSQVVTAGNSLAQARARAASERAQAFFTLEQKKADWQKARLKAELPKELASDQEWARLQLELEKAAKEKEKAEMAMAATEVATEAAVEIEELALRKAEIALSRAEHGVSVLHVTAPRAGVVQVADSPQEDRPYQAGDSTWPGLTVASLPDLDSLYVEATLFDVDDGRVDAGDPVRARLDAFPSEVLEGTVRSVASFAQEEGHRSSRRSFKVQVDLEGIDAARMRPGMSVKLEVLPPPVEGLVAPRAALGFGEAGAALHLEGGGAVPVSLGACDRRGCLVEPADPVDPAGFGEGLALAVATRSPRIAQGAVSEGTDS